MSTHAPVHSRPTRATPTPRRAATRRTAIAAPPRPLMLTLGLAALWVALILALELSAQHAAGMAALDAWAYAIGIVSYIFLFAGFVVGLVYLVNHADRRDQTPGDH